MEREIRELSADESGRAFAAMRELRTHLRDEAAFVRHVNDVQRPEGYRLVGAFEGGARDALAVAGFRLATSLSWGRFLYVDDLSTVAAARRRGLAAALLGWLLDEAAREECDSLHLDSGTTPDRFDAHALYHARGLRIMAHHFAATVRPSSP